jgi:pimeloyl-ACP methyl ester carboxylesterase
MSDSVAQGMHVTRWGDESGKPVVMIHGSTQGSPMGGEHHFAAQMSLADHGWRIIAPDRPGHGKSPARGLPDDMDAEAQYVADLLGEGAHLVGHSFGGAIAFATAGLYPARVKSLTLIEPALQMLAIGRPAVQDFVSKQIALFGSDRPAAEVALEFRRMAGIPDGLMPGEGNNRPLGGVGAALRRVVFSPIDVQQQYAATIAAAGMPVLVVSGGWNPAFNDTCEHAAQLTGGEYRVVEAPHHFPNIYSPQEFNQLLDSFMRRAERGSLRAAEREADSAAVQQSQ